MIKGRSTSIQLTEDRVVKTTSLQEILFYRYMEENRPEGLKHIEIPRLISCDTKKCSVTLTRLKGFPESHPYRHFGRGAIDGPDGVDLYFSAIDELARIFIPLGVLKYHSDEYEDYGYVITKLGGYPDAFRRYSSEDDFRNLFDRLNRKFYENGGRIVFCHGDLSPSNSCPDSGTGKLQLVDFEKCGYKMDGFDIGRLYSLLVYDNEAQKRILERITREREDMLPSFLLTVILRNIRKYHSVTERAKYTSALPARAATRFTVETASLIEKCFAKTLELALALYK